MCTEFITKTLGGKEDSMITPGKLCKYLLQLKEGI